MRFTRITVDPGQMGGAPCIRSLRIPVATVVGMVADGMADDEILAAYPDLDQEDIREALRYAANAVRERALPPDEASDSDPLCQAALGVEQDEALAVAMAEWEAATVDDGLAPDPPPRPAR
jgi:uncharacterized protein (DUF433 family)